MVHPHKHYLHFFLYLNHIANCEIQTLSKHFLILLALCQTSKLLTMSLNWVSEKKNEEKLKIFSSLYSVILSGCGHGGRGK